MDMLTIDHIFNMMGYWLESLGLEERGDAKFQ
jgi:hypothetical protein